MKKTKITIPPYYGELTIIVSSNLLKVCKKHGYELWLAEREGFVDNPTPYEYTAVFHSSASNALIAHETVHLVNYIYRDCCIIPDLDNDEPQAYLTMWIFEQIENFLNSAKPSKSKI